MILNVNWKKEKQKQLKAQEKKLKAQLSQEERKKRTKHLIEIGGAVCKVMNEDTVEGSQINADDVTNLIAFLKQQNQRGDYFSKAMHRTPKPKNLHSETKKKETMVWCRTAC